ncbi:MAG: DUF192 domain-containing protein [Candidatus Eremiobacteraeota bacterium]|nr:DUF192 domain-containing protein [Candidatus Eremiobacteraeota bacterium]
MTLVEVRSGRVLAGRIERAAGPLGRTIGLLTRSRLDPDEGMWFDGCSAVHTLGMRVPIDVVFLDERGCVLHVEPSVRPWRAAVAARGAHDVLELAAGSCERWGVVAGTRLELR